MKLSSTPGDDPSTRGWNADPFGRFDNRWWDGQKWTERVRTGNQAGIDPPGINHAPRTEASTDAAPAAPIEDALFPLRPRKAADRIAVFVSCLVFLGLIAIFVVALVQP